MARPNGYRMQGGHAYDGEIPARVLERILKRTHFGSIRVPRSREACDLWLGGLTDGGRPRISWFDGERDITAAVTTLLYRVKRLDGAPIPSGKLLCHTCDVYTCVNWNHVYLGTPVFNGSDLRHRGSAADQGIRLLELGKQLELRRGEPLPKWLDSQARVFRLLEAA